MFFCCSIYCLLSAPGTLEVMFLGVFITQGKGRKEAKLLTSYSTTQGILLKTRRHNVSGDFIMAFPGLPSPWRLQERGPERRSPTASLSSSSQALLPAALHGAQWPSLPAVRRIRNWFFKNFWRARYKKKNSLPMVSYALAQPCREFLVLKAKSRVKHYLHVKVWFVPILPLWGGTDRAIST